MHFPGFHRQRPTCKAEPRNHHKPTEHGPQTANHNAALSAISSRWGKQHAYQKRNRADDQEYENDQGERTNSIF